MNITATVEPVGLRKKVAVFVDGAFIGERIYENIHDVDGNIVGVADLVAYIKSCYEVDLIPQW